MSTEVTQLDEDALRLAVKCADTLLGLRAYTPGSMLVMLVGRFRDDMREALEMECLPPVRRGTERHEFGELISGELDSLFGATGILLQDRFTRQMDDPALPAVLRGFLAQLDGEKAERRKAIEEITRKAKAS